MGNRDDNTPAIGEGDGWHWVSWVDQEGWPLGSEPCDCGAKTGHTEQC